MHASRSLKLFIVFLGILLLASTTTANEEEAECSSESGICKNPDTEQAAAEQDAEPVTEQVEQTEQAEDTEQPEQVEQAEQSESPDQTEDPKPTEPAAEPFNPSCPPREHIIKCAEEKLDTNKNGKLDREELEAAINKLPWYSKGILKILGSVDKIMVKCDVDKDGAIGMGYDMEHNKETCLATCFKRKAFKAAFFPDCE